MATQQSSRRRMSTSACLTFPVPPTKALLLLFLVSAAVLHSHAGRPPYVRSPAAVPPPTAPPPGRADPTDFREFLMPPPPAKLWPRWSLLEPNRNYASWRWAQCLARDVAYIAPYTCNLRWRESMEFCALLVSNNKNIVPLKPGADSNPASNDDRAAATAIAAAEILDTRDYVRMMSFEPYISCLEKASAENRSLNDARVRVFTCSSSRQWPAYALDSLSRAKDACDALLPESLVEPAADF